MNYPFDTTGLCSEEIDRFHDTYQALRENFSIEVTGQIDFRLEDFEVFKHYTELTLKDSYAIKHENNDGYLLFIEACFNALGAKTGINHCREYQAWGLAYLKKDFGRVMIRLETLADKLIELLHPVELDFDEDKAFSDTFYVLVNDRKKAIAAMDRNFRNVVMDVRADDFVIEIINHTVIIGTRKPVTRENALHMAQFVARICSLC
ncbi:hypothetical protein [Mucilaginibacter xinganensis]|uniref:Uncharacterized protein n=1 Tax=Mucilaginibacter xinganensis TaxID=1234841 RepID=A0A223NV97_9SPHI|nr:hypothetical protein [Mucilaginibacter xinganensis]ASU33809.1 hypothetical protein MuYL_1913 [Mucilaginibacter xinganensis]